MSTPQKEFGETAAMELTEREEVSLKPRLVKGTLFTTQVVFMCYE